MNRRAWVVIAAGIVVLATTAGTGAVSSMSADRAMNVNVVDDENAYLGVDAESIETEDGTVVRVTVTNRFPDGTILDITVHHAGVTLSPDNHLLESGETEKVTFEKPDCQENVTIVASGNGVTVELDREVDCP